MSQGHEQFISLVSQLARLSWDEAEQAARATLETLAERLSSGQARDLAQHLPEEVRPWLATSTGAEGFRADEFIRRVARREGLEDLEEAERHVRAVFDALQRFVPDQELDDMESELSADYTALTEPLPPRRTSAPPEPLPAEEFLRRVADRAATDAETARRATTVVLETLAERIAPGEAEDLAAQLADELREPVRRAAAGHRKAARMSLEEFLDRIAEREGITRDDAREHARAVFTTLREAVPAEEISDLMAQLPKEYADIAAPA